MSFLKSLKKAFTYTGTGQDDDESDNTSKEDTKQPTPKRPRLDIGNPLQRIKDVKNEAVNAIKNSYNTSNNNIMSDHTKYLIYGAYHNEVEKRVKKGKPIEEARILYKRFLDDHVTDEALYTDEDLEYIEALVRYIKEINNSKVPSNVNRDSLIERITNHPRFLNIVEVLDVNYGYKMMDFFCERCYVICGYFYKSKGNRLGNIVPIRVPHFYLDINDSTFILLNEIQSLISNESSIQDKEIYIIKKISPFFGRYVTLNNVPDKILFDVLTTFDNLIQPDADVRILKNVTQKFVNPVREELTEEQIQAKMFDGIRDEANPINSLRKDERFANLYGPLADPRNPNVTVEELEEAVKDIEHMMEAESYELDRDEFKVFSTIKRRLEIMKGGGI